MEPHAEGGEGLCIYLLDPEVPGWDRDFNGTGPLGFLGKTGAILGVGVDCAGHFAGQPHHVAIRRASDGHMLGEPEKVPEGVLTPWKEWRKINIRFDIAENKIDVKVGGKKLIDDQAFEGVQIPPTVCVGVCAGTSKLT